MKSEVDFLWGIDSDVIHEVRPMDLGGRSPSNFWARTRCGQEFRVSDSYAVHFDSSARRLEFVVCPDCAARLNAPLHLSP